MKGFNKDYVMTCARIVEHGHKLHGIDEPEGITATFHQGKPKQIELEGAIYRFKVGNASRTNHQATRTYWKEECLICGHGHHTNEHESRVVLVEHDYQQTQPEHRLVPRRVENFVAPGEVLRPKFYSDVIYAKEDGEYIVGNRMRREVQDRHTTTTYATITEEGRILPSQQLGDH
jgi:hypothetical protein